MIRPDIISELEWQQHGSWESIQRLLAQRTQSLYTEIEQLRDRLSSLQNTAMEMTDGRITRLSQYRSDAR
jgi:hypothetical protein